VPFLRVIRDKRGYETTYLLHWYREGTRQRSRILYVFRTPGGVRVGRQPFDPALMREIEAQYPDIEFDWAVMREQRQVIESAPEVRRRRPRREEVAEGAPPMATSPQADPGHVPGEPAPRETPPGPLTIPSTLDGDTPAEQMAFLQRWYPIVLERIPRRTADPARQAALLALASRLNPEEWTDVDDMTVGLQQAAEALERLSRVLSRRRRRVRSRSTSTVDEAAGDVSAGPQDRDPDRPDHST
jgi:hypothetical protein